MNANLDPDSGEKKNAYPDPQHCWYVVYLNSLMDGVLNQAEDGGLAAEC